jgi:predicted unusual protein kinase regulating ubiquinone biosynthesis (AarF/ABC1/UbiB family)
VGRLARVASIGFSSGAARAEKTAQVLASMRGLAAKVGQMASYVDGIVPEEHRASYESWLSHLRSQAARSDPGEVRALVESELGKPVGELFAEWEDEPFASASIGQVHRARMEDGRVLAVKVQHPGIAKAVESDLSSAGLVESMIGSLGGRRLDSKGLLEVLKTRFREELDYVHEAEQLRFFAELHAGDPQISIPALVASRSSRRVLTTEMVHGRTFEDACAAGDAERRAWAETLWRFVYRGNLVGGRFNADPHPGNYIFHDDARITFLDYGCVQKIGPAALAGARAMHEAAVRRDEASFTTRVSTMIGAKPGPLEDAARAYIRRCFEPIFAAPFRITRPYTASLVVSTKDLAGVARTVKDDQLFTMPPEMLFMNRLQFGFYSVLARMDVEVDYAAIEERIHAEIPAYDAAH